MDKKALKEAGKEWVDVTVKNFKKIFDDPTGVKKFIKTYQSGKKKGQRTKSRVAQRTGNKYMIDKPTIKVKKKGEIQKGKIQKERPRGGLKAGGLAKRGYGISKRGR